IVNKIVNSDTGEIVYQGGKTEIDTVASSETVDYMKELLYEVIYNDLYYSTGAGYKMDGYDLIGKTGTAQYVNSSTGEYYFDDINYIRSFVGMFPKDDPEIIIYTVVKKPSGGSSALKTVVRGLVKDISNYMGIYDENEEVSTYTVENYINKSVSDIKSDLENKFSEVVIIGDGDKVINQYPSANTELSITEKVYLLTNGDNITMPNMSYWSLKEVDIYSKLSNIDYIYNGSGFVSEQSIEEGTIITSKNKIEVVLSSKIES
ncbi:MAG TPA: penicillin-binding transpeptidase domain-containing protein, partial [Bacilli bacterium]|nr:penicillin-binding transpeptidase domain-containing protein [Bacilli bacterium]